MIFDSIFARFNLISEKKSQATKLVERADHANRARNWGQAAKYYEKALAILADNDGLWVQYGHSLKEQGKLEQAEKAYRTAIGLNGQNADTHLQLGHLLKLREDFSGAAKSYEDALRIDPNFSFARDELNNPGLHIAVAKTKPRDETVKILLPYFDEAYYLERNPDVAQSKVDPLAHFCNDGWKEHRNPTGWFDTAFYLRTNGDVRSSGINPFLHYVLYGKEEGRNTKETSDERLGLLASLRDVSRPAPPVFSGVHGSDAALTAAVSDAISAHPRGLVVSVSHSCYIEVVAGTELVVGKEQLKFNDAKYAYIHLSPASFSDFVFETEPEDTHCKVVVDGVLIGVYTVASVIEVLGRQTSSPTPRIFAIHSVLGHSLEALYSLHDHFKPTKSYFWLHDYASLCTGYNLLRNQIDYCGAPPLDSVACSLCIFGQERHRRVKQMKALFDRISFHVLSPSQIALDIWLKSFDGVWSEASVVPHGTLVENKAQNVPASDKKIVKVAFVGYPVEHKGWRTFKAIVGSNRFDDRYEFIHFVSEKFKHDPDRDIRRVHTEISALSERSVIDLLREHDIDVVVIPSGWPETFSFVTFESIAAGCLVLTVKDSGNVAATVRGLNKGEVFETSAALESFFQGTGVEELLEKRSPSKQRFDFLFTGTTSEAVNALGKFNA
ncbi:tetratricopeptide repeat protein [Rhizobium sp. CC-YZS058]|uniref:tetratricopeptide repeat-containing glycosyltransferase family protein n=1 Tax=Rhizobium sp. CC-YZS058 TaxID=3042153 RepID=UPI002B05A100|nr:tetratricopeptide repeat protein [Rhizobium sp. CC-YZS058]MEA3535645.1 tetratricopeptide repeat protein [Rhizobium sp. CC-YZS058]